jgi:hypothetical protein
MKLRLVKSAGYVVRLGRKECLYDIYGKASGTVPLGGTRYRCEDNIKTYLTEREGVMYAGVIWLDVGTSGKL